MSRYIDADKLLDRIQNPYEKAFVARWVREEPTADVRRDERSEWVRREGIGVYCNVCQLGWDFVQGVPAEYRHYNYCPFCGAKMVQGEEEQ